MSRGWSVRQAVFSGAHEQPIFVMSRVLLVLLPLTLAACASTTVPVAKDAAVAAADKNVICDRETRTGSSLPTKTCRSAEQRDADRRAAEELEAGIRMRTGQNGRPGP